MNIFSKFYCRLYQTTLRVMTPLIPYKQPTILLNHDELLKIIEENNLDNIMIVTGKKIRGSGLTQPLEDFLTDNGIAFIVFDDTQVNPTTKSVEQAASVYKLNNCQATIALGGGSVIDTAKAMGARIACPNKPLSEMKGILKVNHKVPTLIAIPTTAGSGSETTFTAVITDAETKHKYTINDFDLMPQYAMLDAKLTLTLPANTTATTGMDALTHAIEAYIGKSTTATSRRNALTAIKLIFENLEIAYTDGTNLQARKRMLKASFKAGVAFSKAYVGYVHAVAHTLGGEYNVSHGLANAVILPHMLKLYGKSVYSKLHKIAKFTGLCDEKTNKKDAAKLVIEKIENMNKNLNIPTKIEGIKEEDVMRLAKIAAKEANPLYPVPKLMTAKELQKIYYLIK